MVGDWTLSVVSGLNPACRLPSPFHGSFQDLRAKAVVMERRLVAAERLIAGLSSEKERWAADIKGLEAAQVQLVGDCLLCSSFLSYTGTGRNLLPCRKRVLCSCQHAGSP